MSIIRENLMEREGYTPYCGADPCSLRWPRTVWDGAQFKCPCGFDTPAGSDAEKPKADCSSSSDCPQQHWTDNDKRTQDDAG